MDARAGVLAPQEQLLQEPDGLLRVRGPAVRQQQGMAGHPRPQREEPRSGREGGTVEGALRSPRGQPLQAPLRTRSIRKLANDLGRLAEGRDREDVDGVVASVGLHEARRTGDHCLKARHGGPGLAVTGVLTRHILGAHAAGGIEEEYDVVGFFRPVRSSLHTRRHFPQRCELVLVFSLVVVHGTWCAHSIFADVDTRGNGVVDDCPGPRLAVAVLDDLLVEGLVPAPRSAPDLVAVAAGATGPAAVDNVPLWVVVVAGGAADGPPAAAAVRGAVVPHPRLRELLVLLAADGAHGVAAPRWAHHVCTAAGGGRPGGQAGGPLDVAADA
mmetsp:Transcript_11913/g.33692  ORF Transcript_11913/g.33692 Transcript_11913/m.33692 type:complete len:328 (+) Transcript_11913:528-1511(+)